MFSLKGVECWTEIYMYKWGIRFTFASVLLFHQANFAVNVLKYFKFKNKKSGDHSSQDEISQFNDQIFSSFRVFFFLLCIFSPMKKKETMGACTATVSLSILIKRSATAVAYNLVFPQRSKEWRKIIINK